MPEIQITGVHYDVSERLKAHISAKLGGLDRFYPGISNIHVTIHKETHHGYRVDVEMHLPHGKDVVAHVTQDTAYAAIDVVADKAAAQLRKAHGKASKRRSDRVRVGAML